MKDKTAEEMFGTEPPGKPVKPKAPTHLAGYRPRGKWVRRSDNKWVKVFESDDRESQDNTRTREPE